VEHAQIAREEVVRVFAEEGLGLAVAAPVNDAPSPVP
jgi:predicted RNase H-like nuclease (RuvC/YqgF family)